MDLIQNINKKNDNLYQQIIQINKMEKKLFFFFYFCFLI